MTKITVTPDCGNAPKKGFLKDFNIAFAKGDVDFIIEHVSDDIRWEIYGDQSIQGKEQFSKAINAMKNYVADEVIIHTIITHGKEASLQGEMKMTDKTYAFCDVYRFASAGSSIIKEMHSYVIETTQ
ncbi:nuclear transport factor 2 family protein [Reichenbachiella agariperforans]|uniref:nuclear transport factor 2 family protein n=1 Tax=Reichenbachiella agariperforans TaxID=156994 RepID=UPI001C08BF92|nr:nuclear transport factor 2 family protein [Reichenbachiella agariperforans]MBU2916240.1 nuclear transport factor 2 family protein [Reichenbachiella agariperforans]